MAHKGLSELRSAVAHARDRIAGYRSQGKSINEANTKKGLIEPVLAALGWDCRTDDVQCEYRRKPKNDPVDYALFAAGDAVLFVEAKSLGQNLADQKWASQVIRYANDSGVEWCVLTNGDEFRVYNTHAPVPIEEKLFRKVRISDAQQASSVVETLSLLARPNLAKNHLQVLWNAHHVDHRVGRAVADLVAQPRPAFIKLISAATKGLGAREIQASLRRAKLRLEFPVGVAGYAKPVKSRGRSGRGAAEVGLKDLIDAGFVTPPFKIEVEYKGRRFVAEIQEDAAVAFEGKVYPSLSTAGGAAKKKVIGAPAGKEYPATNGWDFWKFSDASTGLMREMAYLRWRFREEAKGQSDGSQAVGHDRKALRVVAGKKRSRVEPDSE